MIPILIILIAGYTFIGAISTLFIGYPRTDKGVTFPGHLLHIALFPYALFVCKKWNRFGGHECAILKCSEETNEEWDN